MNYSKHFGVSSYIFKHFWKFYSSDAIVELQYWNLRLFGAVCHFHFS